MRNKATAILLTLFLGGVGGHKFYLGQTGMGILYLLFFWTFIPAIIAFFEFIGLIVMSDADFNRKFNGTTQTVIQQQTSAKDSAEALGELKKLYDNGVLTAEEYEEKRKKLLDSM